MLVKIIKPKQIKLKLAKMSVNSSLIKKLKFFEKYINTPGAREKLTYYLTRISKTDFECYYEKYKYFYKKHCDEKELIIYLNHKTTKIKEMIQKFKKTNNNELLHQYIMPNLVLIIEYSLKHNYVDEIINEL